jgi:hypothetical protein
LEPHREQLDRRRRWAASARSAVDPLDMAAELFGERE